jgi:hypothetical protein
MTDSQLLQSFSNLIQNCGPSSNNDFNIFNNNTNITLKTDYMSYAFSVQNQYNQNTDCRDNGGIDNFMFNNYNTFIFNNILLIINLLQYCIFANLPNSFKYVINNKNVKLSEENYNSLMDYCNGVKIEFICALISVANIIDKYNFIPNLNYKYNLKPPNDTPVSFVYVLN